MYEINNSTHNTKASEPRKRDPLAFGRSLSGERYVMPVLGGPACLRRDYFLNSRWAINSSTTPGSANVEVSPN